MAPLTLCLRSIPLKRSLDRMALPERRGRGAETKDGDKYSVFCSIQIRTPETPKTSNFAAHSFCLI